MCRVPLLCHSKICLKDVFSRKTPTIDVGNGQKRNVENVLEALRVLVAEKEEISRQRIDELERNSKGVKTLKAKKKGFKMRRTSKCYGTSTEGEVTNGETTR